MMSLKKMYIMLRSKILNIEYLLLLTVSLNAKINEVKAEIPSINNLATNVFLDPKINDVKCEIPNITNLTTTTALTAVENKMPSFDIRNNGLKQEKKQFLKKFSINYCDQSSSDNLHIKLLTSKT